MRRLFQISIFTYCVLLLSGCGIVEGIFKAGMWTAFLIVGVVVALIVWLIVKFSSRGRD